MYPRQTFIIQVLLFIVEINNTCHIPYFDFFLYYFFAEDPYYWGLRARIPNFVKSRNKSSKKNGAPEPQMPLLKSKSAGSALGGGRQEESPYSLPPHPFWWHNRMYHQGNNDPGQMSKSILKCLGAC